MCDASESQSESAVAPAAGESHCWLLRRADSALAAMAAQLRHLLHDRDALGERCAHLERQLAFAVARNAGLDVSVGALNMGTWRPRGGPPGCANCAAEVQLRRGAELALAQAADDLAVERRLCLAAREDRASLAAALRARTNETEARLSSLNSTMQYALALLCPNRMSPSLSTTARATGDALPVPEATAAAIVLLRPRFLITAEVSNFERAVMAPVEAVPTSDNRGQHDDHHDVRGVSMSFQSGSDSESAARASSAANSSEVTSIRRSAVQPTHRTQTSEPSLLRPQTSLQPQADSEAHLDRDAVGADTPSQPATGDAAESDSASSRSNGLKGSLRSSELLGAPSHRSLMRSWGSESGEHLESLSSGTVTAERRRELADSDSQSDSTTESESAGPAPSSNALESQASESAAHQLTTRGQPEPPGRHVTIGTGGRLAASEPPSAQHRQAGTTGRDSEARSGTVPATLLRRMLKPHSWPIHPMPSNSHGDSVIAAGAAATASGNPILTRIRGAEGAAASAGVTVSSDGSLPDTVAVVAADSDSDWVLLAAAAARAQPASGTAQAACAEPAALSTGDTAATGVDTFPSPRLDRGGRGIRAEAESQSADYMARHQREADLRVRARARMPASFEPVPPLHSWSSSLHVARRQGGGTGAATSRWRSGSERTEPDRRASGSLAGCSIMVTTARRKRGKSPDAPVFVPPRTLH